MPMGVELECSNLDIKEAPAGAKKGTLITQDRRTFKAVFEVTSSRDQVVEFVTLTPASTKAELVDALGNMTAQAWLWDKAMEANTGLLVPSSKHKTVAVQGENVKWTLHKLGPIEGMLQITIGVPLRGLPLMYRKFQSGDQHVHERSLRLWEKLRKEAHAGRGVDPSGRPLARMHEDTWGFLLLVIDYINRANSPYGKPYAKAQFDTLARTDFATIFGTLPVAEQNLMAPADEKGQRTMRDEWAQWIVEQVLSEEDLKAKPPKRMLPWLTQTNKRPTFHQWLTNMPHQDLFTQKHSPHFLGLGALGNKVDTLEILGQKEPAPIFELRAPLGAGIPYDKWVERISGFWDVYQQLLIPRRPAPRRPPRPPAEAVAAAIRARQELARAEAKEQSRHESGHAVQAREEKVQAFPTPTPTPRPEPLPFETIPSQSAPLPRPVPPPAPFVRTHYPPDRPRSYYDEKDGK